MFGKFRCRSQHTNSKLPLTAFVRTGRQRTLLCFVVARLKSYLAYLLIPAIPYLLMIYSPETVDPIFQYLAYGKGHKFVWVVMFYIFSVSMYFGIVADAKVREAKIKLIDFTKWYLVGVTVLALIYILGGVRS